MGRKAELQADDEIERRILLEIDAKGSVGRTEAADVLHVSRDVIDHMWSGPARGSRRPMRLIEARALADWLGYDLELKRRSATARGIDHTIARADREAAKLRRVAEKPERYAKATRRRRAG